VCAIIVHSVNNVEWKLLQLQITQLGILSDFCVDGRLELWTMKSARQ